MSRKILATYTADPVAGNDPSKGYLIAGDDGDDEPVVLDMNQLAGVMAGKLGLDVPPIDPPVDPDDEDVNQLVITIQDNTLQANIRAISGMTYTHHLILRDDDPDVTYPTGGTWSNLAVPSLVTLTDWAAETFYVWVYNLSTGETKEILDPNGISGVTVTPNDTIAPVVSTTFTKSATEPETEIDYVITATDAGYGVDDSRTVIIDKDTNLPVTADGIATSGTLVFPAGETKELFARVFDFSNNVTESLSVVVALDDPVDTTAGVVEFVEIADPIAAYAQSEATTPLVLNLKLTGNTDGLTKTATVNIRLWTTSFAADDGQIQAYASWTPASGVVEFTDAGTPETLSIVLSDIDSAENYRGEVYIESTSGSPAPDIGTNSAVYFDIEGTGSGASTALQPVADWPSAGDKTFVIDSEHESWSITDDAGGGGYVLDSGYTGAGTTDTNPPAPTNCMDCTGETQNTSSPYYGTSAMMEIDIEVPSDANYYFWLRQLTKFNNFSTWVGVDGIDAASSDYCIINHGTNTWDFSPLCNKNGDRDVSIAVFLTAGVHSVHIAVREAGHIFWDRLHISTNSASTVGPTSLPVLGTLPLSTYGTTVTTDDASNPTDLPPIGAIPASTLAPTLSPPNGATDTNTNPTIAFNFSGGTGISVYDFAITVTADGGAVSGIWDVNVDTATFKLPDGSLPTFAEGTVIAVTGSDTEVGTIINSTGVKKGISIGTWSFTVQAVSGESEFTDVRIPVGGMQNSWYDSAKDNFSRTGSSDLPPDWQALYASSLRQRVVTNSGELSNALNTSLPGDIIMLSGGSWINTSSHMIARSGTATNPIIITSEGKALAGSASTNVAVIDGGLRPFQFTNPARHIILGGMTFQNQPASAIRLNARTNTPVYNDGATDIRITDCKFRGIGKESGTGDAYIKLEEGSHRFEFDYNQITNCYNGLRIRDQQGARGDSDYVPVLDAHVHHNYYGPAPTSGYIGSVNYGVNALQHIAYRPRITNTDADGVFEFNVIEIPQTSGSERDQEVLEIKYPGWTIQKNIIDTDYEGGWNNPSISLRYSYRSTVDSNFTHGCGIRISGANHTLNNNYLDLTNGNHLRGIYMTRWGCRNSAGGCTDEPETHDNAITNNTIIQGGGAHSSAQTKRCMRIGDESGGMVKAIYGNTYTDNLLTTNIGECGSYDTSTEPDQTGNTCSIATNEPATILGGLNGRNPDTDNIDKDTICGNEYDETGPGTTGNMLTATSAGLNGEDVGGCQPPSGAGSTLVP